MLSLVINLMLDLTFLLNLHSYLLQSVEEFYIFLDFLLNIPFFATKNLPSDGSVPAKIAGAPSHFTDMFT